MCLEKQKKSGELFFYYIPRGILKKKPVNVYEIPNKFNIDENQYFQLVNLLYNKIKQLREEFGRSETKELWSNITISINNLKFKVEYNYDDLLNNDFNSYERHIIWRVKYLGVIPEQCTKEEKDIIRRYASQSKQLLRQEYYESGIYIKDVKNIVDYNQNGYENITNIENNKTEKQEGKKQEIKNKKKNQILFSEEEFKNKKQKS